MIADACVDDMFVLLGLGEHLAVLERVEGRIECSGSGFARLRLLALGDDATSDPAEESRGYNPGLVVFVQQLLTMRKICK